MMPTTSESTKPDPNRQTVPMSNRSTNDFENNDNNEIRRRRISRTRSTFKSIPSQASSKCFDYMPIENCIFAVPFKNRSIINAAIERLKRCNIHEATFDGFTIQDEVENNIKSKAIAKLFTNIRVTKINNPSIVIEVTKSIKPLGKQFENLQRLSFEGRYVQLLFSRYAPHSSLKEFEDAILQLAKDCLHLKRIEFVHQYSNNFSFNTVCAKEEVKKLSEKMKKVRKIYFEYTKGKVMD